jgi:CDP-glycerol glycerophosphotransferase (TagB/SpsB family)
MPGELLTTKDAFFDYLKDIDSYAEKWEMKYQKIRELLNPMVDDNASKRVCDLVWGEAVE